MTVDQALSEQPVAAFIPTWAQSPGRSQSRRPVGSMTAAAATGNMSLLLSNHLKFEQMGLLYREGLACSLDLLM